MRNILAFACTATMVLFCSCHKIDNTSPDIDAVEEEKIFYGDICSMDGSKVYMDIDSIIYWNAADRISVFRSNVNECYEFTGNTGELFSKFVKADAQKPSELYARNYAIYPYSESSTSTSDGSFQFDLPCTQHYSENSFGLGANTMTAATSDIHDDIFHFKNACGYLQLKIYGGGIIRQIVLSGNSGEKISGRAILSISEEGFPSLTMEESAQSEVILDCGEEGVATATDKNKPTSFWMVLPPVTFNSGFKIDITDKFGLVTTKKIGKKITIERNRVQPMSPFALSDGGELLSFQLSDEKHTFNAYEIRNGIISIVVSNETPLESIKASFTHNGAKVRVNGIEQSGCECYLNCSNPNSPVNIEVESYTGKVKKYVLRIFNLPVFSIDTPEPITSKEIWTTDCSMKIMTADGNCTDFGPVSVKGRGNSSWSQAKKPYAVKLGKKASVLGLPGHKRWCLLSNCWGYFFGNLVGYELGRRSVGLGWCPHGKYVELILNGDHMGCYILVEQIKVDENRVDITQIQPTDIDGDAVTGGYLMTFDSTMDEEYKFRTKYYNMPVMLKDPDEDVPEAQMNYIMNYFDVFETSLKDNTRFLQREYLDYIDVDSFIDQYFVWEMAGTTESWDGTDFNRPGSVYYSKDRNGKLKAGPVWDFDSYLFYEQKIRCNKAQYYGRLFESPYFVARVKARWPEFRKRTEGATGNEGIVHFIDSLYSTVNFSATRDRAIWPWKGYKSSRTALEQYDVMREGIPAKFDWLENYINSLTVTYDTKSGSTEDFAAQQDRSSDFSFTK